MLVYVYALSQVEMKISPRLCISRNPYIGNFHRKCHESVLVRPYKQNLKNAILQQNSKTRVCLSHLIKREWLMFSLRQYCLDFSIFPMFTFHPHLLPTISWWTRNKNDKCLKHMTSSTLVKCNSMIVSIVMPSYPNVTLFLWYLISEHWTTARTINMKINHDIP